MNTQLSPAELPSDSGPPAEPPRAWWQFSLRTFFVLITLVALALGWFFTGPEKQRRLVAELRERGGDVLFAGEKPDDENQAWLPLAYTHRVQLVGLFGAQDADASLAIACQLSSFTELDIQFSNLTGEGLLRLAVHPELRVLHLGGNEISDAGLRVVESLPNLRTLSLGRTKVTDASMPLIVGLAELESLDLSETRISEDGLASLGKLKELRRLDLRGLSLTDRGVARLVDCQGLTELSLQVTRVSEEGIARLAGLQELTSLSLENLLHAGGLRSLAKLRKLSFLSLARARLTSRQIRVLADFPALEEVSLMGSDVGSSGIHFLTRLNKRLQFDTFREAYGESPDDRIELPAEAGPAP